jgi:hypothetical protein
VVVLHPPEGWFWWNITDPADLALHRAMGGTPDNPPITEVMTNVDRSIDQEVADRARAENLVVKHSALNFVGWVWHADGRWHDFVQVHGKDAGCYSAETLDELMKIVNDEHGWA